MKIRAYGSFTHSRIISTDEDPSLRIESSAIINLRGVSTKLNKYISFLPFLQDLKILIQYASHLYLTVVPVTFFIIQVSCVNTTIYISSL